MRYKFKTLRGLQRKIEQEKSHLEYITKLTRYGLTKRQIEVRKMCIAMSRDRLNEFQQELKYFERNNIEQYLIH